MRRSLLLLFMALAVWAEPPPPTQWSQLHRPAGPDTDRMQALLKAIPARVDGPGWRHIPLRVGGNFVTETWIRGQGQVLNTHFMQSAGSGWVQLETLHYTLPDTFGVILSCGHNPERDGVGVHFGYSHGGEKIVGEGAGLTFQTWSKGKAGPEIPVLRYPVQLAEPYQLSPWLADESLQRLRKLTSAEAMRSIALQGYAEIVPAFRQQLEQHRVKRKEYGDYKGGGIPPEVRLVEISDQEGQRLLGEVEAQVALWKAAMEAHWQEFYQTFRQTVPW